MAKEWLRDMPRRLGATGDLLITFAPIIVFAALAVFLLMRATISLSMPADKNLLSSLAVPGGIIALSFGAGYAVKILLRGTDAAPGTTDAPANPLRDRLARQVVTFGSLGIAAIAILLILELASTEDAANELSKTGLNIFTSILPVFSTWVGTVLAFYFTNESFRQAAESTQGLLRDSGATDPITRPGTMVAYDRIIRKELKAEEVAAAGGDAKSAAANLKLSEVRSLFQPPGVVRIIVFDNNRHPVFVVRQDLMPEVLTDAAKEAERTFKDYLDKDTNRDKALNFAWTGKMATIDDGRRLLEIRRVTDLFVTEHGRGDEQVLGWVPDESLKKVGS